jgi:serine/threonine protein kinase/formylglycine-generating enzyme required for sulfatase activity
MELNLVAPTEVPGEAGPHGTKVTKPLPTLEEVAKHFPQLEILEFLGRGGMGVVYKARQPKLNRVVALKILAPERVADPKFAERFAREAQALARLNHPHIVTVYDFGEADGLYFLLMEFADGVSLRQLLQTRKIEPEEALAIVPKICEALQYAHDEGVVHRDIKPENILLDKKGRVKIADFGIAKIVGGEQPRSGAAGSEDSLLTPSLSPSGGERVPAIAGEGPLTQEQVLGTPNYMAPEQVEHPQKVDHRADIYSLGVVFYEMLTGELPLGKFQPPSKKVHVDVRLDEVVLHTLEKEPELRYQKASQVKTAVETIAHTPPPPPAAPPLIAEPAVNAWQPAILVVAVLFGVIGLLVGPSLPHPVNVIFSVVAGFVLLVAIIKLAGLWPFPSPVFPKSNFTSRNLRRGRADLSVPPSGDQASLEAARQEVKAPASWLVATGVLNWIAIPLIVLSIAAAGGGGRTTTISVLLALLAVLFLSSAIIVAGLKMKRLEAYSLAITGSMLAILITPGNLIGLPIGIWAIVVLSRREVRAAFAKTRLGSLEAVQPTRSGAAWNVAVAATLVLIVAFGVLFWARSHSARSEGLNRSWPAEAAVDLGGGIQMEFVLIHPGSFRMGSDLGDEGPAREVTITEPFYLGKYEVTQEQWEAVMGTNPSLFKGPKLPVENVSADDAQDFLGRVRTKTGRALALPTEAQWEYSCRAGSSTRYSFGDSPASLGEYAWFADNSDRITHPVGEKKPNRWGLYDMHGNVWERCRDGNNLHAIRGGAYSLEPKGLRSSNRAEDSRGYSRVGLRCVLVDKSGLGGQELAKDDGSSVWRIKELAKDGGSSAGQSSERGSGHAVRFEAPSKDCYLMAVRIFGSRYGDPQPPRENAFVWLCDTSFQKIAEFAVPYSYFVRGGPRWVTIPVRPTKVPLDFIVCVGFNPTRTKGVYVHYDSGGSGSSFLGLPGGMGQPFDKGDWLIRAVVREENTPATNGVPRRYGMTGAAPATPKSSSAVSGRKSEPSPRPAGAPETREDIDKDIPLAEALHRANERFPDPQPLTEEEVIAAVRNIKQKHPDIPDAVYQAYQRVVSEHMLPKGMYFSQIPGWVTEHGTFEVDWKDLTLDCDRAGVGAEKPGTVFNYRIRARFVSSEPR